MKVEIFFELHKRLCNTYTNAWAQLEPKYWGAKIAENKIKWY
jgi:hypothetical protein